MFRKKFVEKEKKIEGILIFVFLKSSEMFADLSLSEIGAKLNFSSNFFGRKTSDVAET